jgi:hypothetical protein
MQSARTTGADDLAQYRSAGREFCRQIALQAGGSEAARRDPAETLARVTRLVLSDRVAFFLRVEASLDQGMLILSGESERLEFSALLEEIFRQLGFARVQNRIEPVPDPARLPEPFGVVTAPHVPTWSRPDLGGMGMDEALYGEPVYLLKELPNAWLLKTFSGYWGYAAKTGIRQINKPEFLQRLNAPFVTLARAMEMADTWAPTGARLALRRWGTGLSCGVRLPDGRSAEVPKRWLVRPERHQVVRKVLAQARKYLSAPYRLGGKNAQEGIDCSGLVQMSFRAAGINLPRDACQQYLGGHLILPCAAEALQPGDALFFIGMNGQVDHTALYIGHGRAIHATGKQVVMEQSLEIADPNHLRRYPAEFIGAKRFWW